MLLRFLRIEALGDTATVMATRGACLKQSSNTTLISKEEHDETCISKKAYNFWRPCHMFYLLTLFRGDPCSAVGRTINW